MTVVDFDLLREPPEHARAYRECADWLAALTIQGKAPRSQRQYGLTVWDLLEAHPDKCAAEFTTGDVERLLAGYKLGSGLSPRIAHLNSWFKYLYRRELIERNPMDFLEPRRKQRAKLPDYFSDAEVELLYATSPLLVLMVEAGLRRGECLRLQLRNVVSLRNPKTKEREPYLSILGTKGGKDRLVPLTERAQAAIAELVALEGLNSHDHFWHSRPGGRSVIERSRPISYTTFARWFRLSLERAGVRYRKPHMTRHTCATRMRQQGYELDEIKEFLGHESIETTSDLYVHTNIYDVAARMRELEAVA